MDISKLGRGQVDSPPLICIYGSPGIGKTAFSIGATAETGYKIGKENHILMNVDFRGADRLDCFRLFDKPIESTDDIKNAIKALAEQEHKFDWLIIDDLSTLEELFVTEVCREHDVDNLKKIDYGRGYELARTKWHFIFEMFRQLQEVRKIGIILIGHTKVDTQKDPMSESYSRHDLQLSKASKEILKKSLELIAFAHKKVLTKTVDSGFGKKESLPVGESTRVLTFAPDIEGFESKDRFGLPSEINLDWSIFEAELKKAQSAKTKAKGEK